LATTPLKRYEWILSRTIYNVLISFLGMAVMILIGTLVFNLKIILDAVSVLMVAMASPVPTSRLSTTSLSRRLPSCRAS
jgi:hypothetical protein